MLPSQNVRAVYLGPNGSVIEARHDGPSTAVSERPKGRWLRRAELLQQQRATTAAGAEAGAEAHAQDESDAASTVVAQLQKRVANSTHGYSTTRPSPSASRLADQLLLARLTADRLAAGPVVDVLDEEMQVKVLAAVGLEDAGAAAQTCKAWATFLRGRDDLWEGLLTSDSAIVASDSAIVASDSAIVASDSGRRPLPPSAIMPAASWQALGRQRQRELAALQTRWRHGLCNSLESVGGGSLYSLHTEYIMSMAVHAGTLVAGGADHLVSLTDVSSWARRRAGRPTRGIADDSDDEGESHFARVVLRAALSGGSHPASHADGTGGSGGGGGGLSAAGRPRVLRGHHGQVLCVHAYGAHVASCATGGEVCIWSVAEERQLRWHAHMGRVYSVALGETTVGCGGEGDTPVRLYDWRHGTPLYEAPDAEPPSGITPCEHLWTANPNPNPL